MRLEKRTVFRSRISVLIVGFILILFTYSFVMVFKENQYQEMYILGVAFIFIAFILSGIRYIILGDKLHTKIWMIPIRSVKISQIVSVKRSYNPITSFAASLKRLKIDLKGSKYQFLLISPVKELKFIEKLQEINSKINVQAPDKEGLWRVQDWDI